MRQRLHLEGLRLIRTEEDTSAIGTIAIIYVASTTATVSAVALTHQEEAVKAQQVEEGEEQAVLAVTSSPTLGACLQLLRVDP